MLLAVLLALIVLLLMLTLPNVIAWAVDMILLVRERRSAKHKRPRRRAN